MLVPKSERSIANVREGPAIPCLVDKVVGEGATLSSREVSPALLFSDIDEGRGTLALLFCDNEHGQGKSRERGRSDRGHQLCWTELQIHFDGTRCTFLSPRPRVTKPKNKSSAELAQHT